MADTGEKHPLHDLSEAYKITAASPHGAAVIQDLVSRFGWTRQTLFNTDAGKMAWNEGARAVVVHIGRMIDMDTSQIVDTSLSRGIDV